MNPGAAGLPPFWRAMTPLVLGLCLSGCQQAYFRVLNAGSTDTAPLAESFDPARGLVLDVYRPARGSGAAPVVVFVHGGSWRHGRRGYYRFLGKAMSEQGFLALVPDYRKAPQHAFPGFIDDIAAATVWARENARKFGGDPCRIFLMGHSAGAHIVALLGTDRRYLEARGMRPRDLAGVIGLAGPYDFLPISDRRIEQVFPDHSLWPQTQPVNFVDGDEPPFLLFHGDADTKVWKQNSERLATRLRAAGEQVSLHILPGVGHLGLVSSFASRRHSRVLALTSDWIRHRSAHEASAIEECGARP